MEIDRIREFLDYHESTKVTRKELEELGNLERALDRTWKYARCLATSEDLDACSSGRHLKGLQEIPQGGYYGRTEQPRES